MSVTSLYFLIFCTISLIIYFCLPRRWRWVLLLIDSIVFYFLNATAYTAIYIAASIISVYFATRKFKSLDEVAAIPELDNETKEKLQKRKRMIMVLVLVFNLGLLMVLKYTNLGITLVNLVLIGAKSEVRIESVKWVASLGISYYTLQIISYLLDCYWGSVEVEKNIFKLTLFTSYFPQMVSGPISRYGEIGKQLIEGHSYDYKRVTYAAQRILWGFFKKLVISERLAIIVTTVFADPSAYNGFYVWLGILLFPMQLYTDFSGCMDIVLGVSEAFGITLPENFKTPFFSRTIQEFWNRFHITLGLWLRDYIMYPILKSALWRKMGKSLKKKFGKKASKKIPTYLGMFFLWMAMGLWHGNSIKYIVGEGFWFWLVIVLGQICEPLFVKIKTFLKINDQCFSWHLFQSIRTYCVYSFGMLFFRADSFLGSLDMIKCGFKDLHFSSILNQPFVNLGLEVQDIVICILALIIMLIIELLSQTESVRERVARQNIVFRWTAYYALLFFVLIFGCYGVGYNAAAFIYAQF